MTIEQRKVSLIKWITDLNDGEILSELEGFRSKSIKELPPEIVQLIIESDNSPIEDCIEHTQTKALLKRK